MSMKLILLRHGESEWNQFMAGIEQVYPDARVEDLENDHPIFHTVYDLSERLQVPGYQIVERGSMWERNNGINPYWRVISDEKGRVIAGIIPNSDIGDSWEYADDPRYQERFSALGIRIATQIDSVSTVPISEVGHRMVMLLSAATVT